MAEYGKSKLKLRNSKSCSGPPYKKNGKAWGQSGESKTDHWKAKPRTQQIIWQRVNTGIYNKWLLWRKETGEEGGGEGCDGGKWRGFGESRSKKSGGKLKWSWTAYRF